MKRLSSFIVSFIFSSVCVAQTVDSDSIFHTYIYNDEYKVYFDIDFYNESVQVPGQDIFGAVPGYFGAMRDSRKWLVTSAKISGRNRADLDIVNDYGSEDLTATLQYNSSDNTYTLRQTGGSRLKIVVNRKWVKIPTELVFVRHERVADKWWRSYKMLYKC